MSVMIIINILFLTDVLMLIIVEPRHGDTCSGLRTDEVLLHNVQTASVIRTGTRIDNNAKIKTLY